MENHVDLIGVPTEGFIHRVVEDFLGEVVGSGGIGVHAGALADRLQAGQDLNGICVVLAHQQRATRSGVG